MEKRFITFVMLVIPITIGFFLLRANFIPLPPAAPVKVAKQEDGKDEKGDPKEKAVDKKGVAGDPAQIKDNPPEPKEKPDEPKEGEAAQQQPRKTSPQKWVTLGSVDQDSSHRFLATFQSQGAVLERVELSSNRYRDLDDTSGYLGHLALEALPNGGGCRVRVVGGGTPAEKAGLQDARLAQAAAGKKEAEDVATAAPLGDVIISIDSKPTRNLAEFKSVIESTSPGQSVSITVMRSGAKKQLKATLTKRPLEVVRPEISKDKEGNVERHPLSFPMTLQSLGGASIPRGEEEIPGLPSLKESNWETKVIPGKNPVVEFRYLLSQDDLKQIGQTGALEIVKRYRLSQAPVSNKGEESGPSLAKDYHIDMELEFHNLGKTDLQFSYRLDGPSGLPLEGWWYSNKIHPTKFSGAGARDIVVKTSEGGHVLIPLSGIYKNVLKKPETPYLPLLNQELDAAQSLDYIGVDAQYFAAVLLPLKDGLGGKPLFRKAIAYSTSNITKEKNSLLKKKFNVTFRATSEAQILAGDKKTNHTYRIFVGPKEPGILAAYELSDCISYGWFGFVAKPLSTLLHTLYWIVGNYGIAIILMTLLVRALMLPLSRKAAHNAKLMQQMAPELKKIKEKYKDNMEKQAQSQRELQKKHGFQPLGGCLLLFFQMPIFLGLYRSLSVDIELRQASFIPGLQWCSNLAGPDKLFYWESYLPASLAGEAGWLGPYLNILPLFTVALFMVHQKLFTPPAVDEQTRMQQKVMSFMMLFMGLLFFKVPAGLCLYFITSSLWGVAERLLLPAPKVKDPDEKKKTSLITNVIEKVKEQSQNGSSKKESLADKKSRRKQRRK